MGCGQLAHCPPFVLLTRLADTQILSAHPGQGARMQSGPTQPNHWDWGMKWGHCVSSDMVHWSHVGVALSPTSKMSDSCGCWSGCATVDHDGVPSALYTGVRLKGAEYDGPEQRDYAPGEPMTEAVLLARCLDKEDSDLAKWGPGHVVIADPPEFGGSDELLDCAARMFGLRCPMHVGRDARSWRAGCDLEGWRDPFVLRGGKKGERWQMVMASGKCRHGDTDGIVLLYSADTLEGPWRYDGICFQGDRRAGRVAECPGLVQIYHKSDGAAEQVDPADTERKKTTDTTFIRTDSTQPGHKGKHLLAFASYDGSKQNDGWEWDPNLYYIGDFDGRTFTPECEPGNIPRRLDIGDAPYAPNFQVDAQGRLFVWVWLRESRPESLPEVDYNGCLGIPRLMSYLPACASSASRDSLLFQEPLPELAALRGQKLWSRKRDGRESVADALSVPGVCGAHWEAVVTLKRESAAHSCLVVTASSGMDCLLLAISWETDQLVWVKGDEAALLAAASFDEVKERGHRTMCGPLGMTEARAAGVAMADSNVCKDTDELTLRVFVDGSAVEAFTGTGQVASTRLYCEQGGVRRLWVKTFGGDTSVYGDAFEVGTIWRAASTGEPTDSAIAGDA